MKIITVSREFGSGGRELGRRLADAMDIAYYDREIIDKIAENLKMDSQYIENVLSHGYIRQYPYTFRRRFRFPEKEADQYPNLLAEQTKIIRDLAGKEDCVIVGRGADVLLQNYCPFKIFVYADLESKIRRCRQLAPEEEHLSDREMEQKMKRIDKARASDYSLISSQKWGDKGYYHLCVNTAGLEITSIVPFIAEYASYWLALNQQEKR